MKRTLLSALVANAFLAAPAAAQEAMEWSGSVSAGVRNVDSDAQDPSKLNEYRDLQEGNSGIFGFELRGRSDQNYFNAYGENLGRDDQYLDLNGGRYNTFKYRLYSDQLQHNFGSGPGALSPFSGIGGATLTAPSPLPAAPLWGTFDHSYKRRDIGGMFELQKTSPWYFRVEANEVRRDGINVYAGANGTSPGNGFTDLPSPIDWLTRNYSAEVGYSTRRAHFAVNLSHSTFENENDVLLWSNRFFANGLDSTMLPPDNELTRLAINGNLRQLPLDSTLAGRFTYSKLTNDVNMLQNTLSTGGANPATNPSAASFGGDIVKTTLGLSLSSRPMQALDTKLYFNWVKEENDSTRMSFSPAAGSGLTGGSASAIANCNSTATVACTPEMFEYEKRQYGAEAGWRVTRANKLTGGLEWTEIERERADFQENEESRVFAEWKNTSFDWMSSRLKYQFMQRRGDFNPHQDVLAANPMDLFVRLRRGERRPEPGQARARFHAGPAARPGPRGDLQGEPVQGHAARPHRGHAPRGLRERRLRRPEELARAPLRRHRVRQVRFPTPRGNRQSRSGDAAERRDLQLELEERGQLLADRHRRRLGRAHAPDAEGFAHLCRNRRPHRLQRAAGRRSDAAARDRRERRHDPRRVQPERGVRA